MSKESREIESAVIATLKDVLQLESDAKIVPQTRLLGGLPEFDSLAVASVIVGLEEKFALEFDEEEIHADIFVSVSALCDFVAQQRQPSGEATQTTKPAFLAARSGQLFTVQHLAHGQRDRCVVFVPPFAEEMNRCRELITSTAMALNAAGISCCLFDLYGTGDSAGDFGAARWSQWVGDLHDVVKQLRSEGFGKIDLVAIRLGALLGIDYIDSHAADIGRVVVWDPVFDAAAFLKQFLRIRSMATMMEGKSESVSALYDQLKSGSSVEIAGYELHPELADALQANDASRSFEQSDTPLYWLACKEDSGASAAVDRVGCRLIEKQILAYPAYWSAAESTEGSGLIQATVECLTTPIHE